MKLDLHDLVIRRLDWDDAIPDNLRCIWKSNFEMISEIKNVRYNRAIVPDDSVSLDLNTIDFGDASRGMVCVTIYARFKRSGNHSCQLVLARSKLVPDGMSLPRAGLFAAVLNTHSGEIVRKAFYNVHKGHLKISDSQIALHWIKSEDRPLKQWVRNRVIEIRRFTKVEDWRYVESTNMIADLGRRKGCTLNDVMPDSHWINGHCWMTNDSESFPVKRIEEMNFTEEDMLAARKEMPSSNGLSPTSHSQNYSLIRYVQDKTLERYIFQIHYGPKQIQI